MWSRTSKVGSCATSWTHERELETFCRSVPGINLTQSAPNTSLVEKPPEVNWPQKYAGSIVVQVSCHSLFIRYCFHWNSQHLTDFSIRTGSWTSVLGEVPSMDNGVLCWDPKLEQPRSDEASEVFCFYNVLLPEDTNRVSKPRSRALPLVNMYIYVLSSRNLSQINGMYFKDSWISSVPPSA